MVKFYKNRNKEIINIINEIDNKKIEKIEKIILNTKKK